MALIVPGWNPSPLKGDLGAASISSISNVASTSNTTGNTITMPSVQAGDVAVCLDAAGGYGVPGAVTPSGWTNTNTQTNGSTTRVSAHVLRCVGTESGTVYTCMTGALGVARGIVILRGNYPIATITAGGANNGAFNAADPGAISITGSTAPSLILGFYRTDTGTVDPRTFSTTKDGEFGFAANILYIAWKLYGTGSTPAASSIDMADEGGGNLIMGVYLNLTI